MITVLVCRGIGEPMHTGLPSYVTRLLTSRFRVIEVPWEATYGPFGGGLGGSSYDAALASGRLMLLEYIRRYPGAILLSYSAGAALAGNVAAEIGRGVHPGLEVRAVGLLADPLRPKSVELPGHGIAGERPIQASFPVWQVADPRDPIPCCTSEALYTLADQSAAFSLVDPAAWGWDLIDRLKNDRWQEVKRLQFWRIPEILTRYRIAIEHVQRYLGPDHVSYPVRNYPGTSRTYTEWLADRINEIRE